VFSREVHQRPVLVHSFYLDQLEVSNQLYAQWLNDHVPYETPVGAKVYSRGQLLLDLDHESEATHGIEYRDGKFVARAGHEQKPVVQVTWNGALFYCHFRGGDLPTEAQWELAARGPVHGMLARAPRYPWGDDPPRCDGVVLGRSPGGPCQGQGVGPAAVGSASQDVTENGIHDLSGNVDEWVWDVYKDPYPSCGWCIDPKYPDPAAAEDRAAERAVRGGCYSVNPVYGASGGRSHHAADYDFDGTGFRCAAALRPSTL
jgi:formylglycine-generating enzyme required for sulfatase activity